MCTFATALIPVFWQFHTPGEIVPFKTNVGVVVDREWGYCTYTYSIHNLCPSNYGMQVWWMKYACGSDVAVGQRTHTCTYSYVYTVVEVSHQSAFALAKSTTSHVYMISPVSSPTAETARQTHKMVTISFLNAGHAVKEYQCWRITTKEAKVRPQFAHNWKWSSSTNLFSSVLKCYIYVRRVVPSKLSADMCTGVQVNGIQCWLVLWQSS